MPFPCTVRHVGHVRRFQRLYPMNAKRITVLLLLAVCAAGCFCTTTPYDYAENWVIREDPVRAFAVHEDVFYVQSLLYTNVASAAHIYAHARGEVGNGRFSGIARVFSPLIAAPEDLERALDWYFKYHHEGRRPFVFIGEGEGGAMLKAYEEENSKHLLKNGLVASFYREIPDSGFVTEEMVKEIRLAVARARYKGIWGREMPSSMQSE